MSYLKADIKELNNTLSELNERFNNFKQRNLKLDMSRGKPCSEQLDLSNGMMNILGDDDYILNDGTDCRNYGGIDGIPAAKELFSQMLQAKSSEIIIGGNSSLSMMYDTIARAFNNGVFGGEKPWSKLPVVKFLCPSPGYDRHFSICELFNIEMITIEMKSTGPDMDEVEKLVKEDASIKGIWCVPKYSNPEGKTYSDEVVDRLAGMPTAAKDFRIFWDNSYAVHHLGEKQDTLKDMLQACKALGNADRVFIFSSTSKISFSGSGLGMMAASENNINLIRKQMSIQTIGPDKLNQLRHVRFFKNMKEIETHMKKHAAIVKPKFDAVLDFLEKELAGKGIAEWNKPNGGYFISLNVLENCAKEVVAMAKDAGVILTPAGATYPYGRDPRDRNIRIAPTYPSLEEMKIAAEILCVCVQIVCIKKILKVT